MEIVRVQRWVASALTLTIAFVWAGGMVLGALITIDQDRKGAQIAILVMAAIISVLAIVGVRLINELSWLTPWLLAGLIPSLAGVIALMSR
jgi:FtsH-binding integral membrane protein